MEMAGSERTQEEKRFSCREGTGKCPLQGGGFCLTPFLPGWMEMEWKRECKSLFGGVELNCICECGVWGAFETSMG